MENNNVTTTAGNVIASTAKRASILSRSRCSLHSNSPAVVQFKSGETMSLKEEPPVMTTTATMHEASTSAAAVDGAADVEPTDDTDGDSTQCPVCLNQSTGIPAILRQCAHHCCIKCAATYISLAINESRVPCKCWECDAKIHPNDVEMILLSPEAGVDGVTLLAKYEQFSVRRALIVDPDTRWCPSPDCKYACIASNCAACPALMCELCRTQFCYHCKAEWHEKQTCEQARSTRGSYNLQDIVAAGDADWPVKPGDIRACPRCRTYIAKLDDGSCNHMTCGWCGVDFCWLCLKEVTDLHYLSPSGCTFWGRQRWSRKKVVLWQFGTLIGAPIGIALIAALALPAIIFGVPVLAARKTNARLSERSGIRPCHRHLLVMLSTLTAILIGPILATIAVGIGVPLLLAYVYGVVPYSLCRQGVCRGDTEENDNDAVPVHHDIMNTFQAITRQVNETESMRLLQNIVGGAASNANNAPTATNEHATAVPDTQSTSSSLLARASRSDDAGDASKRRKFRASSTASRETTNVQSQSLAVHYDLHSHTSSKTRQRRTSNDSSMTTATAVSAAPNYDTASTNAVRPSQHIGAASIATSANEQRAGGEDEATSEFVMISPEVMWQMQQSRAVNVNRSDAEATDDVNVRWRSVTALIEQTSRYMGQSESQQQLVGDWFTNVFHSQSASSSASHRHSVHYDNGGGVSGRRAVLLQQNDALLEEGNIIASVSYASLPAMTCAHSSVLRTSRSSINTAAMGDR